MSYLLILLLMFFLPVLLGLGFLSDSEEGGSGIFTSWLYGTLFMMAGFELVYIPCYFLKRSYLFLQLSYGSLLSLALLLELLFYRKRILALLQGFRKEKCSAVLVLALLLSAFITYVPAFYTSEDADDAFYVATATTTQETGTLFFYDPYTGKEAKKVESRYVLSPFPIYMANLSSVSRIPAAMLVHRVIPMFFVPMALSILYLFGQQFYERQKKKKHLFYLLAVLLTLFSGYSIKNASVFLLYRIWQGKAFLAAVLVPVVWLLFLKSYKKEKESVSFYLLLTMVCLAGGMVSSMGIFLIPMLIGFLALVLGIYKKSFSRLAFSVLCAWPGVLLGLVYLLVLS